MSGALKPLNLHVPPFKAIPALALAAGCMARTFAADFEAGLVWYPHPVQIILEADHRFEHGPVSGAWASDIHHHNGQWLVGDGFGSIWYSEDGEDWHRARFRTAEGSDRPIQNAPVRSIHISGNGTMLATFLGVGEPSDDAQDGLAHHPRAPLARSVDGRSWTVVEPPESCGAHFSATDGDGTWIVQGCESRLLVSRDDARSWEIVETGLPGRIQAQAFLHGVWISANSATPQAGIYASRDLKEWRRVKALPRRVAAKRTITFGDRAVMMGSRNYVATSSDGVTWKRRHLATEPDRPDTPQAGILHPQLGTILGTRAGRLLYSRDLKNWHSVKIPGFSSIVGLAANDEGEVLATGYFDGDVLYHGIAASNKGAKEILLGPDELAGRTVRTHCDDTPAPESKTP